MSADPNILTDIQNLQQQEKNLYAELDTLGGEENKEQQDAIIQQINELTDARITLLNELTSSFSTANDVLDKSRRSLKSELSLVGVVEDELNKVKRNYDALISNETNRIRMIQISNYEVERTYAHKEIFKTVVVGLAIVLGFAVLYKNDLIPSSVLSGGIIITLAVLIIMVVRRMLDLQFRSNFVYEQYNWGTPGNVNANKTASSSQASSYFSQPKVNISVVTPVESSNTEGFCNYH